MLLSKIGLGKLDKKMLPICLFFLLFRKLFVYLQYKFKLKLFCNMRKYLKLFLALLITLFVINLFGPILALVGWIICTIVGTLVMFAVLTYIGKKYNIKLFN